MIPVMRPWLGKEEAEASEDQSQDGNTVVDMGGGWNVVAQG